MSYSPAMWPMTLFPQEFRVGLNVFDTYNWIDYQIGVITAELVRPIDVGLETVRIRR